MEAVNDVQHNLLIESFCSAYADVVRGVAKRNLYRSCNACRTQVPIPARDPDTHWGVAEAAAGHTCQLQSVLEYYLAQRGGIEILCHVEHAMVYDIWAAMMEQRFRWIHLAEVKATDLARWVSEVDPFKEITRFETTLELLLREKLREPVHGRFGGIQYD